MYVEHRFTVFLYIGYLIAQFYEPYNACFSLSETKRELLKIK